MTLLGGPADKLGNRYEKWWTLSEFVRLLHGDADAIRIEDPGVEKAEFVVTRGSRREWHQVKRSHPNGKWSLAALRTDGLLHTVGRQLAGNDDRFVFASGSDARELSELCEAACDAESVEEFERSFLAAGGRKLRFERLLCEWACDVPAAVERLRRIDVRTIDERELEQKVCWGVQALFVADPNKVVAELRAIADDSVHRTITRQGFVEALARRGYRLRHLTNPENAGVAVEGATETYLEGARSKLIGRELIPRTVAGTAAQTLLARLDETSTDSVLTGRAGAGKTACVVEVVETLRAYGLPVLAFRLDRLPPTSTTRTLGDHLGLEESPVLVLAAAVEAAGRPGVLIVDQLDAVSTVSGRTSGMFDLVERLLREARGTRARATIHTVAVCREFDWRHDPRLRQLMPRSNEQNQQLEVTEFTTAEVETILTETGFDTALFHKRQLALLRLPRNLSLFLEAGFDVSHAPAFGTAKELFDRYWIEKRRSVAERVTLSPDPWLEVMQTLCDAMTAAQQLSVPSERLDRFAPDYLDQLASEGVLTFDGRRYGFGHESFFDYCFARVFFTRSESLVSFLLASEQHLFRRAQVRQVLVYLRDADFTRYIRELRDLLSNDGIRTHLKDLAFALLAEVTEPTEEEWTIWNEWVTLELEAITGGTRNQNKLSALAWRRLLASSSWFEFADERGIIEGWLDSGNDRLAELAVNYLRLHQRRWPDRVAALLEPYAERGGPWAPRLRFVMQWADHHTSRRFFDLFLRLVANGTLDHARGPIAVNSTFWSMLHDLGKKRPEWVPEVLAYRLQRRLSVLLAAEEDPRSRALLGDDHSFARMLIQVEKNAPAELVEHVLPVVLDISDSALTGDTPPKRDAVWPFLIKTKFPSGEQACLSGLAKALATLAREDATDLREVIAELRRRDSYTANRLLLALYGGGVARHADEAISLLCDEPWRFECGLSDSPHWVAMETIRAVIPHCTTGNCERLETVILGNVSPHERTGAGHIQSERTRFALLSAIPTELRSARANARFQELERKFGEPEGEPHEFVMREVGSPIEKTAAEKMTDDQWLGAIAKYCSEDRMHDLGDSLKGGALEMARVLEDCAKEEPERFARLGLRLPSDANPLYLDHTLAALKDAAIDSELKLRVCRKAFEESCGVCGRSIADVLGDIRDPLPDDALRMLDWLATEHEDPAREAWQEDAGGGQTYYNGDIHFNGINTTRGQAADAVRDLILDDAAYIDRLRPTLERMIRDRSAAVRSCVAGTLRAVFFHDPARGMLLFQDMNLSEDRLLATHHVYHFMLHGLRDGFTDLRPIVDRMLRSSEPEVREAGARLASIAVVVGHESAAALVDDALHGGTGLRLGVAQVAAANVAVPECRAWSETMLRALFDDDDVDVRREAASCFGHFRDETINTYGELIAAFCDSRAYQDDSFWILDSLEESRGWLPGTTCMVCEKFLSRFAGEARDIRTHRAGDAPTVAKLIFRTYQQHQQDEWTARSLDLIDLLCLEGIGEAGGELEQFER